MIILWYAVHILSPIVTDMRLEAVGEEVESEFELFDPAGLSGGENSAFTALALRRIPGGRI